jgi:hypothetical protein
MKYEIKKNFLSPFFFNQIKNIVFSPRFKWEYSDIVAEYSKKDSFYFIHNLFVENSQRSEYFNMTWWSHNLNNRDYLKQRLAYALGQILVISQQGSDVGELGYGTASYYDLLIKNNLI